MKQPLVINNITLNNMTLDYLKSNYPTFELSLYNKVNDLFVKIKLEEFCKLMVSKDSYNLLTYNNSEFLEETTIDKHLEVNDLFLRPYNLNSAFWSDFIPIKTNRINTNSQSNKTNKVR